MDIINDDIVKIKDELKKEFDVVVVDISKEKNEFFLQVKKSDNIDALKISLVGIGDMHHVPTKNYDFFSIKGYQHATC